MAAAAALGASAHSAAISGACPTGAFSEGAFDVFQMGEGTRIAPGSHVRREARF
jgi:hypothetical protein